MREKIKFAGEFASDKFSNHGNCAQAVVWGVSRVIEGIDEELVKVAHSFSAGGAGVGVGACGALSGGMLALSAIFGRTIENMGIDEHKLNADLNLELVEKFNSYFKGHSCNDFQKLINGKIYNLNNPDEKKICKTPEFKSNCKTMVQKVSEWTAELILENSK